MKLNLKQLGMFAFVLMFTAVGCGESFQSAEGVIELQSKGLDPQDQSSQAPSVDAGPVVADPVAVQPAPQPQPPASTPLAPVSVVSEADKDKVKVLYLEVLGRDPDPAGLDFWVGKVEDGLSIAEIRGFFANTAEAKGLVEKLYIKYLKRAPTPTELSQAVAKLALTTTISQIEASVMATANALTQARQIVTNIYIQILARLPDPAGLDFWVTQLQAGMSIADIRKFFANSDESKAYITNLYNIYLARNPSGAELNVAINIMVAGKSIVDAEAVIIQARQSDPNVLFVARLYVSALGRQEDAAGFSYWVNLIRANRTAQTLKAVTKDFLLSPEFVNRKLSDSAFLDAIYLSILGRLPDAAGKEFWLGKLAEGVTREVIIDVFLSVDEANRRYAGL